ncbi:V4R domain-containing protein [Cyanobacterium aponinum UTEX 3222]|uniref:4-vinyl reductase 4VR n=2 Tax=Cyanobacterium aponinum TaxID=379064 RepID=K9Z4M0_CYAAP|nr:V4R domain-containing protein [Cyanobacterium aponinum]WRL42131.1 V4R domain-containing protein [Cyanobacterium aponinum UTEX 3222]AFZ54089.1 4-vinyl reductase 4VR [Cyanobacterium aponinum PCC 10605]PHV62028.1 4-vinyl reductase [Cyanobacterium aponinum IPPAS B-1201]WPF89233.1 V4R domain-containing protein [Cyanobacterium aponinum AL20115]WRL38541.1 V4R domain-containing protein [Cyanobacterium aponinum UTEX 3221]
MISVADLVREKPLKGNYFAPSAYVQGDFELGLLETRLGSRLIALPEVFLQGVYEGLNEELGQASGLVLYNCGKWWGKSFYRRFLQEVSEYYETPLAQMEMVEFLSCLKQCWKTHGWGVIEFNFDYYSQGFIVVNTVNSPFAQAAPQGEGFACQPEAGILTSFFSQLTGEDLLALQTSCESMGASANYFIIGLNERMKSAKAWLEEGHDHEMVINLLCSGSSEA